MASGALEGGSRPCLVVAGAPGIMAPMDASAHQPDDAGSSAQAQPGQGPLASRLAAVDLGSNSFHMVVANVVSGEPVIVDRLREQVQLAGGLDDEGQLTEAARLRALACLRRFGQRLRDMPGTQVRAVGTNTLRAAGNARSFLAEAEEALGHTIEIISGREEARLIYLGVAQSLSDDAGYRLVVDIGGGSTECILGERFEALEVHSLYMGCVAYTKRFFAKGVLREKDMAKATLAARLELQTVERRFADYGWVNAVGASGTIRAVRSVVKANDWSKSGVTRESLQRVREALLSAGHVKQLELEGLKRERRAIFAGGVAILLAIFDSLEIGTMQVSSGALREGAMYDLLGRIRHEDVRERTIRLFQERYHVDRGQAARVRRTALALLLQVARKWDMEDGDNLRFLAWAAQLHEIGLAVSFEHQHRHGGYLIANSDMPGFSRDDQLLLAAVVGWHRRKPKADGIGELPEGLLERAVRLTALLRLAVLLNRGRSPVRAPQLHLRADASALEVRLSAETSESLPLTRMDLESESRYMRSLGIKLKVVEAGG